MRKISRTRLALAATIALVAISVLGLFRSFDSVTQAAETRKQNRALIRDAGELLAALVDAETGQRGYMLTGDSTFLVPYLAVRDSIDDRLNSLLSKSTDRASQAPLKRLEPVVYAKLENLSALIRLRRDSGMAGERVRMLRVDGKRLMDTARVLIRNFTDVENAALGQREAVYARTLRNLFVGITGSSVLAVLFAGALAYLFRQRGRQESAVLVHAQTQHLLTAQEETSAQLRQALLTLADGEERLSVTLNSIGDGVMTTDANAHVVRLNPVAERLTGWTSQEATGRPVDEVFHIVNKDTRRLATIPVAQALEHGTVQGLANHTVLIARDGSERDIADSCAPIRGREDVVIGAVLVFRDVTQEYRAQQALRDSTALIETVLNTVADGIVTFHANDGKVATANPAATRIFGYSANELTGQRVSTLVPELGRDQPDASYEYFRLSDAERTSGLGREVVGHRKDGSTVPIEIAVSETTLGSERYFTGIIRDITARKLVEADQRKLDQRLRDQQFYTRSLIESNIDALMTTDPAGIITDVNKQMEALTGCTRDELIGAPFKGYFTDPERAEAAIKLVLSEKTVSDFELTALSRDGKRTVVSYNATTFYDRTRTLQGVFAAARDVTERKRVEVELQKAKAAAESASRTKSEFLASMSHEIRTPMHAIMGIADLLAKTPLSDEQDRFVQIFRRAGDNLLNLTNDILDLSKVEASQLELEHTGFSIRDLVGKIIEMVAARAQEKGLALVSDVAPNVPPDVVGDPARLQQVLLNLLGNAIKFTETGTITLSVTSDGNVAVPTAIRFTVTDTGIGIPDRQLTRVFERFTQADSSTTRRFGGSGLGLTICKRLVELMGGRIWAESTVNVGSVFAFAVPFELWVGGADQATTALRAEPEAPLLPLRILLVEDSVDNCAITVAYLSETPYQVAIAANGAIAVDMFTAGRYDLVLMDRQMPVMDGLTATRAIRSWEHAHQRTRTPIIALTAAALKGDREQCLSAGCTAFLTKPIRQDVLLRAIANLSAVVRVPTREERIKNTAIVVPDNPQIAERVPTFLQNRRADVTTMRDALARDDLKVVERLGHNMRGTGASYGFQAITDLGSAIEEEAGRGDVLATRHWIDELSDYLGRVAGDSETE